MRSFKKACAAALAAGMALTSFGIIPAAAEETTTIKVMVWDRGDAPSGGTVTDNKMTEYINEQIADLGIQVEFVSTPRSGSEEVLNTWMAGGTAPDIIFTYDQSVFMNYATQDGLADLTEAYETIGTTIQEYTGDVQFMGNLDGVQYALLSKRGAAYPRHTAYIRQDWLDELELPLPTTKEELIETLYAFKEAKPDCIPWAMNGRMDTEKTYLNFVGSYVDFEDEKDEYVYSEGYVIMHDGALDGIRELNKLYNDGIIGKDFATDTDESLFKAAVASGKVGFVLDDNTRIFDYMEALNNDAGGRTFVPVSAFTKADGEIRNPYEYAYGMYIMVPVVSEDKVDACMTYLNWLADPVNAENVAFSPEHTVDDAGVPVAFTGDQLQEMGYKSTLDDFNILNKHFAYTESKEGIVSQWAGVNTWEDKEWFENLYDTIQVGFYRYPTMPLAVDAEVEKGGALRTGMIEYAYRLISCPTEEFDALEEQLHSDLVNGGLEELFEQRAEYWDETHAE